GIEPATSELSALRSNRLSYSPATGACRRRDEQRYRTDRGPPNRTWTRISVLLRQCQLNSADQVRAHVVDEGAERRQRREQHDVDRADQRGAEQDALRGDPEAALGVAAGGAHHLGEG